MKLGFIGAGVMGASMARHLMRAGNELRVHTRTRAKAEPLLDDGAIWCDGIAGLAAASDAVITMLGYPADVEEVWTGEGGLIANARPGSLLIDMTTSCPALAQRLATQAVVAGIEALDAPVSGGDVGAREARLSIMAGGEVAAFKRAQPLFACMGKTIVHQGPAGSGQHCKMANQIAVAASMLGACESIRYAEAAGLDPLRVLDSIATGAAGSWSLSNLAPRMLKGDYAPGFYVKHFIKDLGIALDAARSMQLELPGLELAQRLYERLGREGHADAGTQALIRLYRGC
jgi:3-hydroxyisobutyrate dehydrogenase